MTPPIYEFNTADVFDNNTVDKYITLLKEAFKTKTNVVVFGSEDSQRKFKTMLSGVFSPGERRMVSMKPLPIVLEPISDIADKIAFVIDNQVAVLIYPIVSSLSVSSVRFIAIFHTGPAMTKQ